MKRVLLVTCVLALTACGSSSGERAEPTTAPASHLQTITKGTLTVGTELPAPPFWIGNDYATVTRGFEADIVHELAHRLGGLQVQVVKCPFVSVNAGARCGDDIGFSQITITDARKVQWDFTSPYLDIAQGLMVRTGTHAPDIAAARALHFGVQAETTGLDFLNNRLKPDEQPNVYSTTVEMFRALDTGEVNAILFDVPILLGALKNGQVKHGTVIAQFRTGEQYGAIMPKGSPNTTVIDGTLTAMQRDGTIRRLQQTYFGSATEDAAPFWSV